MGWSPGADVAMLDGCLHRPSGNEDVSYRDILQHESSSVRLRHMNDLVREGRQSALGKSHVDTTNPFSQSSHYTRVSQYLTRSPGGGHGRGSQMKFLNLALKEIKVDGQDQTPVVGGRRSPFHQYSLRSIDQLAVQGNSPHRRDFEQAELIENTTLGLELPGDGSSPLLPPALALRHNQQTSPMKHTEYSAGQSSEPADPVADLLFEAGKHRLGDEKEHYLRQAKANTIREAHVTSSGAITVKVNTKDPEEHATTMLHSRGHVLGDRSEGVGARSIKPENESIDHTDFRPSKEGTQYSNERSVDTKTVADQV